MEEERHIVSRIVRGDLPGGIAGPPGAGDCTAPGISVVMCTYRRAASLKEFLDSLLLQDPRPRRLIIVDASPDDETERMVGVRNGTERLADTLLYFRVEGPLKGLTRQRNFGIRWVATDLVAFFDDDVVLGGGCLAEMERAHRHGAGSIVGVGGYTEGSHRPPDRLWRARRFLGIVTDLRPGSYQRSGMSVPWWFLPPTDHVVDVDWLPGCAMMWNTSVLREIGFGESFEGYAQGEDLDFSLRARKRGRLVMAGGAHYVHRFDESGRPDHFKLGYMAIYNRFQIQRRGLEGRTRRDVALFAYAWGLDTVMLMRHLLFPRRILPTLRQMRGRLKATFDIMTGH